MIAEDFGPVRVLATESIRLHQQPVHHRHVRHDLLVAMRRGVPRQRQFQPVQRALASQRLAAVRLPLAQVYQGHLEVS